MDEFQFILPDIAQKLVNACKDLVLPDSDEVSNWALEKDRRVYIDDDISSNMTAIHKLILRWNMEDRDIDPKTRRPIWLYIMSYGGDLDYMWEIIDAIQASRTPVFTVNIGVAASAASLIFLAGHRRFMMPTSRIIVHEGSAQLAGDAVKVMDQSDSYKKQLKQMKDFILERTEIPKQQLMKKRNNDWELPATYCLEHKACEQIVSSLDELI